MSFSTDQELFETLLLVAKCSKLTFKNCVFEGGFNTAIDFIKDLKVSDLTFQNCSFNPELAIQMIKSLILPSNFAQTLLNLKIIELTEMELEQSR